MPQVNWANRLPEIDIIPVVKNEKDDYEEVEITFEDIEQPKLNKKPVGKRTKKLKKENVTSGYKNPFNYTTPKTTRKNKASRELKNVNLKWLCMICNELQQDKEALLNHYEVHKTEKDKKQRLNTGKVLEGDYFQCSICLQDFTSLRSYNKHTEEKHGEKRFNCDADGCNKSFKNSFQLCIHNSTAHSSDSKYKCNCCNFTTPKRATLKAHLRKHEEEHKFKCEICGKGFATAVWYEEHKNFHTGAMPFECEVCLKSFPYSRYLVAHKKSIHPEVYSNVPVVNECHICEKRFAHKKSLILHIRGHTGENTVLCDMCGKRLSSSEHLKQHVRIHTGYKPHICAVCGKGFAKKCNLTLHERVHSGERPHICKVCGKGFSQRSTLVIHNRYHSGERPYVCQLCNKGFVAKGLLGVHLKTCSGIFD